MLCWWSWYTSLCACAECLLWDFSVLYLLLFLWLRWGGSSYSRAFFSSFCLGVDYGLFVVNLNSANVLFWCITHCTNYIIFFLEEMQPKTCNVDYWIVVISYFSKIFVCFNHLEAKSILQYIVYKSLVDTAQKGHRQRVHKSNFPFRVAFENCL